MTPVKRATIQRVVTLALDVLNERSYGSVQRAVACTEIRLALAVLWCIMPRKRWLTEYWEKANHVSGKPWEGCSEAYHGICHDLRADGWHAPVGGDALYERAERSQS